MATFPWPQCVTPAIWRRLNGADKDGQMSNHRPGQWQDKPKKDNRWPTSRSCDLVLSHYRPRTSALTHWGRVTHICISKWTIISSDNGLSPDRRQAIIWTNAGILLIVPLWTNFSEISIEIPIISFMNMRLKVSSAKWRPFCLGLNVLTLGILRHLTRPRRYFNKFYRWSEKRLRSLKA